jgi:hypothetical protein
MKQTFSRTTLVALVGIAMLITVGSANLCAQAAGSPPGPPAGGPPGPAAGSAPVPAAGGAPASGSVTIPSGTAISIRTIDAVDSSKNKVGDQFHASLNEPLVSGDRVVAPKGANVVGQLSEAKAAGHIAGGSELRLELTGIQINGNMQPVVTGDYQVSGEGRGKQSARRIGGATVLGAIIGAAAGGGRGAAIGAGAGAAAGTAVQLATHGERVKVPSETLLDFTLAQPLTVTLPSAQ